MRLIALLILLTLPLKGFAQEFLIPMDDRQTNHLKAYGIVFKALQQGQEVDWLLNYRGGSFLTAATPTLESEMRIRGVSFERLTHGDASAILAEVESPSQNTATVRLETTPRIAVYAPSQTLPWDDAVLLALNYAEIPFDQIYDNEILDGELANYDWVHLHHEDFTGQYGKFFQYMNQPWFQEQRREAEHAAQRRGFSKVSELKLAVVETLRDFVEQGGFLFAMCTGTETFDVALAAAQTDIVPAEYDGDPVAPDALERLDFSRTLAFQDFMVSLNAFEVLHSDIDAGLPPPALRNPLADFFTLYDFSAKWDPVPSMLTQSHVATIKGFVGQTTSFRKSLLKPGVVILAEAPGRDEVKYLHGMLGQGQFTFYAGHDPEDYQHFVGDPPTDLDLHKNSPGYRLILNNVLFPAARKRPQKT